MISPDFELRMSYRLNNKLHLVFFYRDKIIDPITSSIAPKVARTFGAARMDLDLFTRILSQEILDHRDHIKLIATTDIFL